MLVTANRPLTTAATPAAKPATTAVAATPKAQVPAVVAPATAAGPRAKLGVTGGAIGGGIAGLVGMGGLVLFTSLAGLSWAGAAVAGALVGGAVVCAGIGAGIGWLQGTVEDKVLDKVAKNNPTSQWGFYVSGYGLLHTAGMLLKGGASGLNGAFAGIGALLGGAWQAAVELKHLGDAGPNTDNKLRLGGAIAATVGGAAAAAGMIPAVAAAAPIVIPVGVGLAALGWAANLAGQFMNEQRHQA